MTTSPKVRVIARGGKWAVKVGGSKRAASLHDTRKEAEKRGRALARKRGAVFVMHARSGAVECRADYGATQTGGS